MFVAHALNDRGIATLLFDLLTPAEEADRANVFDIPLLADRLVDAVRWLDGQAPVAKLPLGLFGASTGAGQPARAGRSPRRSGGWCGSVCSRRCSPRPSRARRGQRTLLTPRAKFKLRAHLESS